MKEDGVETLESNPTSSQKGLLRQYPNSWNYSMTSFESPSSVPAYSSPKRKSGWLIPLICLVLFLATTQYYNPRNVRAIPSRLFGLDYVSRVELSSESNTADLSGLARTDEVQFDNYSLILRGQRIFLQYGAFILSVFSILPPSAPENFTHLGCLFRRSGRTF